MSLRELWDMTPILLLLLVLVMKLFRSENYNKASKYFLMPILFPLVVIAGFINITVRGILAPIDWMPLVTLSIFIMSQYFPKKSVQKVLNILGIIWGTLFISSLVFLVLSPVLFGLVD